jgi:hypothetical protein
MKEEQKNKKQQQQQKTIDVGGMIPLTRSWSGYLSLGATTERVNLPINSSGARLFGALPAFSFSSLE